MVVCGYARLMTYDAKYQLKPDILAGVDVQQGRVFTLRLREGHCWSDGTPFTSEDFRYWWEDIANHKKLSPLGALKQMVIAGELAKFEVIDDHTVRFSWNARIRISCRHWPPQRRFISIARLTT